MSEEKNKWMHLFPKAPKDEEYGREVDSIQKARKKAAALWSAANQLQGRYWVKELSYQNQMEQIRKYFDRDGRGIFYLLQQLGRCCFNDEPRQAEAAEEYLVYLLDSLLSVWDDMEMKLHIRPEVSELESPRKEGYSGKILLDYLDIVLQAVEQINSDMDRTQYPAANYKFYEKLWLMMGPYMQELRKSKGETKGKLRESARIWYGQVTKSLNCCGLRILFYEEAGEEERRQWFVVKEGAENVPAVIRTAESGAGCYEYSLGSFPKREV